MFEEEDIPKLIKIGVKDSKLLTHKKRIELSKKIKKLAKKIEVIKVTPSEIDDAVNGNDGLNLNWLEAKKTVEIINKLRPDKVILDCPSPNLRAYKERILSYLDKKIELIVEHKADFKYHIVGVASIIAKVEREKEVEEIKKEYGNIGPGYPSNSITQKFVKENWNKHPEIFRKSWSTFKKESNKKNQKSLEEF